MCPFLFIPYTYLAFLEYAQPPQNILRLIYEVEQSRTSSENLGTDFVQFSIAIDRPVFLAG